MLNICWQRLVFRFQSAFLKPSKFTNSKYFNLLSSRLCNCTRGAVTLMIAQWLKSHHFGTNCLNSIADVYAVSWTKTLNPRVRFTFDIVLWWKWTHKLESAFVVDIFPLAVGNFNAVTNWAFMTLFWHYFCDTFTYLNKLQGWRVIETLLITPNKFLDTKARVSNKKNFQCDGISQ